MADSEDQRGETSLLVLSSDEERGRRLNSIVPCSSKFKYSDTAAGNTATFQLPQSASLSALQIAELETMSPWGHCGPTQEAQKSAEDEFKVFDEMQTWDRFSVEVHIPEPTFQKWLLDIPSSGDEEGTQKFKKLLLFSGNDYLGLSSHPSIPRLEKLPLRRLESSLADLKKKQDCLLCPTGFAANMALVVALGNVGSLLSAGKTPLTHEKIAIFSDALNHASIIDGIRLAERQRSVEIFIYRHCDMTHLNALLSSCTMRKKVVVTDSLFSMDRDFAPITELVKLCREHDFLLVIDDAHGTFVCGKNGGGVAEEYNCERDVDICAGALSKAADCHGGFIACRSLFKLSSLLVTAIAGVVVARKETWCRREIWKWVQDFRTFTGIPINSSIISLIVGSEEKAPRASQFAFPLYPFVCDL
ncbi:hypothetical protein C1H46_005741 [Malus baccata]|uniref:Aminotransferase class I/classII large domain-containing protein n=1 Tax=Malus baccata TaxID=106549 RepID=A0A540NC90_MALBA|nr:hypothetical protein C1H46_005741 [Malus baccata]